MKCSRCQTNMHKNGPGMGSNGEVGPQCCRDTGEKNHYHQMYFVSVIYISRMFILKHFGFVLIYIRIQM